MPHKMRARPSAEWASGKMLDITDQNIVLQAMYPEI